MLDSAGLRVCDLWQEMQVQTKPPMFHEGALQAGAHHQNAGKMITLGMEMRHHNSEITDTMYVVYVFALDVFWFVTFHT